MSKQKIIKEWYAEIGSKGGTSKSEKKSTSSRNNAAKAREARKQKLLDKSE